jgi:hypothetical protein
MQASSSNGFDDSQQQGETRAMNPTPGCSKQPNHPSEETWNENAQHENNCRYGKAI